MSKGLDDPYFVASDGYQWLSERRSGWQFGEQGIIDALIERIEPSLTVAVEIGGGDGITLPLTCERLYSRGWRVIAYESDEDSRGKLVGRFPELMALGEFRFDSIPDCSVAVIDIDGLDAVAMRVALDSCIPSVLVVEHYDKAGPYVTGCEFSFGEEIPQWLLGMPLGFPVGSSFRIQNPPEMLDRLAAEFDMVPIVKTRVNSFYVPSWLTQKVKNV